jgi:polyhydroxyalkanoate synthase
MERVTEQTRRILDTHVRNAMEQGAEPPEQDPLNLSEAFLELWSKMWSDPARMFEAQAELWGQYLELWHSALTRAAGGGTEPSAPPARGDRRFRDPDWVDNQVFDFIRQSYLLTSQWLLQTVRGVEGLDPKDAQKIDFYTRQFLDAVSPTNFILTNPAVLRATIETNGQNLVHGFENLLNDLERGNGRLQISMTDLDAFEVGENVATTPGKVVFQNELMQLLQYEPTTTEVYRTPLLIVPPWINKFYILDLRPENSFIKWATDQGYTVFVVSWVNPDKRLAEKDFEDYMLQGPLAALDAIEQATGEREVTAIGYCIGGTLMAATLAYMAAKGDDRIKACTFFAAQVDFADAGELMVFIDEQQIQSLEQTMERQGGVLEGSQMATSFNMLRSNDLIWSYVVDNYLLGKDPVPFDLLYWNSDSTRMPSRMHSYYLRNMYLDNRLVEPGALTLDGVPIDLTKVEIPIYLQAAKEDHIAPPDSVFKATKLYRGPVHFMLAGSGHIAGVVNAPVAQKYQHWTTENGGTAESVAAWLETAEEHPGSWWTDWDAWLAPLSGERVPARQPGDGKLPALEDAPGSYAKMP